jgi:UDP-GlcNAc:undecaprenyl-phosphate GlcNAc-1-phosphate transferase
VNRTPRVALIAAMAACLIGMIVLLIPRFKPHAPRIVERLFPPRYRRSGADAAEDVQDGPDLQGGPADDTAVAKVRDILTEGDDMVAQGSAAATAALSCEDEELLRKIGTGAHAAGRHSGASGRNGR